MSFELRPYQKRCVDFLKVRQRGFVIAPAGSGKTVIAAHAIAAVAVPGDRVGWIANTREQVEQGAAAIGQTEGAEGVEFDLWCAAAQPDVSECSILVIDEAAHLPAETWLATASAACGRVFGFSATPWSDTNPERDDVLREFFGGIENFTEIFQQEVRASGHLAEGHVIFLDLDKPGEFDEAIQAKAEPEIKQRCRRFWNVPEFEHRRRVLWQFTQEAVQQNAARNAAAVHTAKQHATAGQSVLVLVASIEHGIELGSQIEGSLVVSSKMPGGVKARRAAIAAFKDGSCKVLISTQLADEGLDVPIASVLVLVAGGRSAAKIIQRAGRVMRPFPGKTTGLVYDFSDRGAKFALAQARARKKVYQELGYTIETKSFSGA
jgi:superfamily II DNA or RNA helicase